VLFAGFNALSKSESLILSELEIETKAAVLFDADLYYLNDKRQEAGLFLRDQLAKRQDTKFSFITDNLLTKPYDVDIHACANHVAQLNKVADLLSTLSEDELNETVVVLGEESDLSLLLELLPENIKKFNITLGFGLQQTPVADFITLFHEMHIRAGSVKGSTGKYTLRYATISKLLLHPVFNGNPELQSQLSSFRDILKAEYALFPEPEDVINLLGESDLVNTMIKPVENTFSHMI
jgi:hypothetical protein